MVLYYYYAGWVDATVLSRCSGNGEWEGVGRGGRGLCYGCDGWAKRERRCTTREMQATAWQAAVIRLRQARVKVVRYREGTYDQGWVGSALR